MDPTAYDLVVIGSGPAGHHAAIQAAKLHRRTLLLERKAFQLLFATQDKDEGINAFKERRKPQFKGQ